MPKFTSRTMLFPFVGFFLSAMSVSLNTAAFSGEHFRSMSYRGSEPYRSDEPTYAHATYSNAPVYANRESRMIFSDGKENFSPFSSRLDTIDDLRQSGSDSKGKNTGLLRNISLGGAWIPSFGDDGMGMARFNAGATFALPGPKLSGGYPSYFLISPQFGYTNVDWNRPTPFPDSLYEAGLNLNWMQVISPNKTLMLIASPSYSGDGEASSDAVRCSAVLGLKWAINPRLELLLGVAYLDREDVDFIPYGGLIWTPTPDWRIELLAPLARVAKRLNHWSDASTRRWVYLGGGFEGGSWAVKSVGDRSDFAMYREFSVLLGYEAERVDAASWNLELGYLFARKMEFDHGTQPTCKPDDSLILRLKYSF